MWGHSKKEIIDKLGGREVSPDFDHAGSLILDCYPPFHVEINNIRAKFLFLSIFVSSSDQSLKVELLDQRSYKIMILLFIVH